MWTPDTPLRWTDDTIAEMRRLIVEKGFSARLAALEMRIPRNAVIGKCRRLGIPLNEARKMNGQVYAHNPELRTVARKTLHDNLVKKGLRAPGPVPAAKAPRRRVDVAIRNKKHSGSSLPSQCADPWTAATSDSRPAPLWLIAHNACRWPLYGAASDDVWENMFCGAHAEGAYCEAHRRASVRG